MSYSSIPSAWRDVGKAVKKDLVDNIHNNLEALNSRVTSVEGSISTAIIANQSIKKERDHAPIGTIVYSPLSTAQFQAATDDGGWALCDGASATGTDYGTLISRSVLPDIRGKFIRAAAGTTGTTYNPDGNVATDTLQVESVTAHTHSMTHTHADTFAVGGTFASSAHRHIMSHVHQVGYYQDEAGISPAALWNMTTADETRSVQSPSTVGGTLTATLSTAHHGGGSGSTYDGVSTNRYGGGDRYLYSGGATSTPSGDAGTAATGTPSATASPTISGAVTTFIGATASAGSGAGNETRPVNVTENCFIKINKNYITVRNGYLLWRAPQALTINQVVLTPVTQGTSGTLTIDIKKGALGSITTSIFTAAPTLVYTDAVAKTGTLNATNAQIAAGEYVRVDITTTQAKLQEFHILIAATPT